MSGFSVLLALQAAIPAGAVPGLINYQGQVSILDDGPFTGTGQFKFVILGDPLAPPISYWSNDGTSVAGSEPVDPVSVQVVESLFHAMLGEAPMAPLSPSLFDDDELYLRIWFDDGTHGSQVLSPDQRITSVGFAMGHAIPNPMVTALVTNVLVFVILLYSPINFPPERLPAERDRG